jgi:DNA repair exonuclease SbcCD nuclease subunit
MFVIPGNHDTYYKNTNIVNSIDLLLREYPNIHIIEKPSIQVFDNRQVAFSPWICADNYTESMNIFSVPADLCIGHFELEGFHMFRGIKSEGGLDRSVLKNYEMVLTGHFHHRSTEDNIYYLGSPYEFTWADHDDPRGFHILDTRTLDISFIENPYTTFHKIYYDDTKAQTFNFELYKKGCVKVIVVNKTDYVQFDKFIETLYFNEVVELSIHDDFSEFENDQGQSDNINVEDTMSLLSEYIDSTESSRDKEKLKTLLKTLYVEAQHLEL